ncbi:MAG: hypothetical protein K6T86_04255 [Pirellulales bacterium]|nr:hypothetical protein [Pirellulales bacterium]
MSDPWAQFLQGLLPLASGRCYAGGMEQSGEQPPVDRPNRSAPSAASNPYASPLASGGPSWSASSPPRRGGVTAVCVLLILLGAMGVLGSLLQVGSMLIAERMQSFAAGVQGPGLSPEAQEIQQRMNERMMDLLRGWRPVFLPLYGVNLVVSGVLVAGAIGVLQRFARGKVLLIVGLWGALGYLLLHTPANLIYAAKSMGIVQEFTPELMRATGPQGDAPPAGAEEVMQTTMMVTRFLAFGWILIWSLGQAAFYLFSIFYLRKRA